MNALRRIWQVRAVVDALHTNQALDVVPGEVEMSGKADGQTTRGLLDGDVEGLMGKAAAGSPLRYRLRGDVGSAARLPDSNGRATAAGTGTGPHFGGKVSLATG